MSGVDAAAAIALRSDALYVRITGTSARGPEVKAISPFATREGAVAEAGRVSTLMSGTLVRDQVVVDGARRDLTGKRVMLSGLPANGAICFVLGVAEGATSSTLTVLRKLP